MNDLLKGKRGSGTPLEWTDEAERAFLNLRQALCNSPILQLIDSELGFILQTDASDTGIGGVLLQAREGDPKRLAPVMYLSCRLHPPERNYSVVEREALAIY